jgi:hypothetical protein
MNKETNALPASSLHAGLPLSKAVQFETDIFIENRSSSVSETTDWHSANFGVHGGFMFLLEYRNPDCCVSELWSYKREFDCLTCHGLGSKIQRLLYDYTTNELCSDRTESFNIDKTKIHHWIRT